MQAVEREIVPANGRIKAVRHPGVSAADIKQPVKLVIAGGRRAGRRARAIDRLRRALGELHPLGAICGGSERWADADLGVYPRVRSCLANHGRTGRRVVESEGRAPGRLDDPHSFCRNELRAVYGAVTVIKKPVDFAPPRA